MQKFRIFKAKVGIFKAKKVGIFKAKKVGIFRQKLRFFLVFLHFRHPPAISEKNKSALKIQRQIPNKKNILYTFPHKRDLLSQFPAYINVHSCVEELNILLTLFQNIKIFCEKKLYKTQKFRKYGDRRWGDIRR